MSGHGEKKMIRVHGVLTENPNWVPPKSPKKKRTTSRMLAHTKKAPSDPVNAHRPTTRGFGHCAIKGCKNAHLDHSHICCNTNCQHFIHTLCATKNHLYDKDDELRIFCSSSCKGDPKSSNLEDNQGGKPRAQKRTKAKATATNANAQATQKDSDEDGKPKANKRSKTKPTGTNKKTPTTQKDSNTKNQPHTTKFASVAKKPATQTDYESENDRNPEQSDSGGDQDAKPRAKHKKEKIPFTSKIFDQKRTQRLQNRHDPQILQQKLQEFKQKQEKRKQAQKQRTAFENESQLFNEFYNNTLKTPLRNNRRKDTPQTNDERINQAVTQVNAYMQEHYSEVSSDTTQSPQLQNEADIIQKIIYEPITDTKPEHSFTIIHEDGSKQERIRTAWLEYTIGKPIVYIALKTGKRIHYLGKQQCAFTLPSGDTNHDLAPPSCLVKYDEKGRRQKKIKYPQGDSPHCFMNSFASALHYIGKFHESRIAHNRADEFSNIDLIDQFKRLTDLVTRQMIDIIPESKSHNWKDSTVQELLQAAPNEQLMIVVPKPNSRGTSHAVTICMGLVFDSTQKYPLYSTQETYDFISGSTGFERTYMTRSFRLQLH